MRVVDTFSVDNIIEVPGCGYDYISDRYCRLSAEERDLDMELLGDILEARRVEEGLCSELWARGIATERIFWEVRDAKSEWARGGINNILLYNPTASTNRYAFKL